MFDLEGVDLDKLRKALVGASAFERAVIKWRLEMHSKLRPKQIAPPGDWAIWAVLCGRGFGKNFLASYDAISFAIANPGSHVAVVAATHSDCRKTCFENQSGIIPMMPQAFFLNGDIDKGYNRSLLQIHFDNGSLIEGHSAEQPDRLRGPNYARAICDEIAAWTRLQETFDMLQMTLRSGDDPRTVIVSTPRPLPFLKDLVSRAGDDVVITTGSSFENADNLAPSYLANMRKRYEGTRLGDQELHGMILESIDGALWSQELLDECRVHSMPSDFVRIVVGVDPSGSTGVSGDETGIVVAGMRYEGDDERYYVLADRSLRGGPNEWGKATIDAYNYFQADLIVAEKNFGGAMVEATIYNVDKNVPVKMVSATRGKSIRAGAVTVLYKQGRAHHVGKYRILEDQMMAMTELGYQGGSSGRKSANKSISEDGDEELSNSPDRLDAAVWALTELSGMDSDIGSWTIGQQRI